VKSVDKRISQRSNGLLIYVYMPLTLSSYFLMTKGQHLMAINNAKDNTEFDHVTLNSDYTDCSWSVRPE
jgi:hypothetical protein